MDVCICCVCFSSLFGRPTGEKAILFSVSLALSCITCTIHAQFSPYRQGNIMKKIKQQQQFNHFSLCIVCYISFYLLHYASHIRCSPFAIRSNTCNTFIFNFNSCLLSIFFEFAFISLDDYDQTSINSRSDRLDFSIANILHEKKQIRAHNVLVL